MTEIRTVSSKNAPDVDVEDVEAAIGGDAEAFTRLVERYTPTIIAQSCAMVGDREAARDVAQEAFVQAWRDRRRLRVAASFVPWLRQITRNQALIYLRRRRRRAADYATFDAEPAIASQPAQSTDSARLLQARESHAAVREALDALPEPSREPMILFYRQELGVAEVAALLGISEGAVKKRLQRGRAALREAMLERFSAEPPAMSYDGGFVGGVTAAILKAQAPLWSGLGGLAALAGKVLPGVLMGTAGVLFGFWLHWRRARDGHERRGLLALTGFNLIAASLFPLALSDGGKLQLLIVLGAFMASMAWSNLRWLPRVIGRRQALERVEDPRAEGRQRLERRLGWAGLWIGSVIGVLAILLA